MYYSGDNEFCQTEKFSQQSFDLVWISLNQSLKFSLFQLVSLETCIQSESK